MFPKFLRTIGIKKKKRATKEERTVAGEPPIEELNLLVRTFS